MLGRRMLVLAALVMLVAIPALAGDGEKCTYKTQDCLDHMAANMQKSGFVGVELEPSEETDGYVIVRVVSDSPAEGAGLQSGDVLYALEGVVINDENKDSLKAAKKDWKPGQSVTYTIIRDGNDQEVSLTLAPMPADVLAKWIGQHMLEHASVEVAQN